MVDLHLKGSFADLLFQYCFARTLAERWGYTLRSAPLAFFPNTRRALPGKELKCPHRKWSGDWPFDETRRQPIDESELQVPPNCRLELNGTFRRSELFAERGEAIRQDWFAVSDVPSLRPFGELAICVDHGASAHARLQAREIIALARAVPHTKLSLFTSDPWHPDFENLGPLQPELIVLDGWRSLVEIGAFQKVGISRSHFFWWAAFLGRAREIYLPQNLPDHPSNPVLHPYPGNVAYRDERFIYNWLPPQEVLAS